MPLNFFPEPKGQEKTIRTAVRQFTDQSIRPFINEDDERTFFRREIFQLAAKEKLTALLIDEKYGGRNLPYQCYYSSFEEYARGSVAMAITIAVTNLAQNIVSQFGNEQQKQEFLPKMASGEWLGAFSLSESGAGSDAAALRMLARRTSGGYVLNGSKCWTSNGKDADVFIVFGRTSDQGNQGISSFIITKGLKGFRIGKQEKKLGLRSSSLTELVFEDCFVPETRLLKEEGFGLKIALSQLDTGRVTIGVIGLGLAWETLEKATQFLKKNPQSGVQFSDFANFYARLQAIRAMIPLVSELLDGRQPVKSMASQIKLLGSDLAMEVTDRALTLLGPEAIGNDPSWTRMFRDAKALQIVEGTNQIQQLLLGRQLEQMA